MENELPEHLRDYPIAIVEDRYNGVYSRGAWLAIAIADKLENGAYRVVRILEHGPHGEDMEAMEFWSDPPTWIASGDTPNEALAKLKEKLKA